MSPKPLLAAAATAAAFVLGSALPVSADVPSYRHKSDIPASQSDRMKLAAAYAETPGRTLRAPSGPVVARQVAIGNSRFIVFSNTGRNSARDIADTARRYTDCSVSRSAKFRTIRSAGIIPSGYVMPCSG